MTGKSLKVKVPVRLMLDDTIAIGPGKADLLAAIQATGSISGAARQMKMSYRRAWMLVETMNGCFDQALVSTARGGRSGGGAKLTEHGETVLNAYVEMQREVQHLASQHLQKLLEKAPLRASSTTSPNVSKANVSKDS